MTRTGRRRFKRPIAVSLAGIIALAVAAFHIYHGLNQLMQLGVLTGGLMVSAFDWRQESSRLMLKSGIEISLAIVALFVILNFLRLRRWSWVVLVLWVTINLIVDLETYIYAEANFLSMIANVIVAFSVLQSDVQVIFGIRKAEAEHGFSF